MVLRSVGIIPHWHFTMKMEAAWTTETLVSYRKTLPSRWRQYGPPKRWYPATSLRLEDGNSVVLRSAGILQHQHFTLKMEAA
jgi:hypothetical protein